MSERPPADSYGDVTAEYFALRGGAGLVVGAHELAWVTGSDAVAFLDGLLTQDLSAMADGEVARSLLLAPQGKLRAPLWLLRGTDRVGLVADHGYGAVAAEDLTRFRFRVQADIGDPEPVLELWGPGAAPILEKIGAVVPNGWWGDDGRVVARIPLGPLDRFVVTGVEAAVLAEAGATPAGTIAATAVRVEAGEPQMGVDVDDRTIPQESGLVPAAVSFTKGCYLGQELVARIDSRGHVNRHLRGVVIAENVLPPLGAEVVAYGKAVGAITSLGESLALRAPVAMALVRREVNPGDEVVLRWEGGETTARVADLPLDAFDLASSPLDDFDSA